MQPPVETLLPWQVAGELLSCLRKWEFRDMLSMFPLRIPTAKAFDIAFDLHARFSLSHWDSMFLGACKEAGINTLFSEDFHPGTDYDGLAVVSPFA